MEAINEYQIELRIKKFQKIASDWIIRFQKEDEELVIIDREEDDMLFRRLNGI